MNDSTATVYHLTTTNVPDPSTAIPAAWGYVAVTVATLFFGSNLVPVKKFETGDGLFFQWILCIAIWLSGFVLNGIRNFPPFQPLAMLGGFLWCTGNVAVVPIIKTVGLSQGMLIWAVVNLLSGWACGRFGWFGLDEDLPASEVLNYIGVALCVVSAVVYMFLRTETTPEPQNGRPLSSEPDESLLSLDARAKRDETNAMTEINKEGTISAVNNESSVESNRVFYDRLSPNVRRVIGIVLAVCAGTLFGLNFTPVIYVQQHYKGASKNGLDYVFSHFCGILATSSLYMVIYCAVMCNRPRIYPRIILPGLISGVMWAIADIGWFVANDALSPIISFPIITSLPAIIGAMWGIFMFREIRGRKNYIIFCSAVFLALSGSILTGLSKYDWGHHGNDDHNSTTASSWSTATSSSSVKQYTETSTALP